MDMGLMASAHPPEDSAYKPQLNWPPSEKPGHVSSQLGRTALSLLPGEKEPFDQVYPQSPQGQKGAPCISLSGSSPAREWSPSASLPALV